MLNVERHLFLVGVRPEFRESYLKLHSAVWPEVEERLRQSHVRNYTIFIREDLLIGYLEYRGSDFAADMALIAADPVTRRWWELTDPCQYSLSDATAGWVEAAEVWSLGEGILRPGVAEEKPGSNRQELS